MKSSDHTALEVQMDGIKEDVKELKDAVDNHINSRIRHFGTVLGASGPVLVVILEIVRLLR